MASILIVFSTREGQTARVVAHLSDALQGMGHQVLACSLATRFAGRPESYDAVIVAASVHAGEHGRRVAAFVKRHRRVLNSRPSAFVSVSLSAAALNEVAGKAAKTQAQRFLDSTGWRPDSIELAAGALRYSRFSRPWRWILRFAQRRFSGELAESGWPDLTTEREYTDWNELSAFARRFDQLLGRGRRGRAASGAGIDA